MVGSIETERGGGEGTYPDDMGEQANVGPLSRVPSELMKEADLPLKREIVRQIVHDNTNEVIE